MMHQGPIVKDLVLVGGGHTHLFVLRMFGMSPVPGVRLTLVTRDIHTPYSGMLPGYVSGFYSYDDCHVDLAALAHFAGARLIQAEADGIDVQAREITLKANSSSSTISGGSRPPLRYDVLSINVGITPAVGVVPGADALTTPVKPIFSFVERFEALLGRARASSEPLSVAVVGGGAGGVELAAALAYRLRKEAEARASSASAPAAKITLLSRGPILGSSARYARRAALPLLQAQGVKVLEGAEVAKVEPGVLVLKGGDGIGPLVHFDECLWCTQAAAPGWFRSSSLPLDQQGFLPIDDCLQVMGCEGSVFACGDCATSVNHPRPKAGVFAVRQGMPLAENLRRVLLGKHLAPFVPQTSFLSLISIGDRYAIGVKGWIGFQGAWAWAVKDWIDRAFMAKFSTDLPSMDDGDDSEGRSTSSAVVSAQEAAAAGLTMEGEAKMRCGACGSKVGSAVLSRVLKQLPPIIQRDDVVTGLSLGSGSPSQGDDMVTGRLPGGGGPSEGDDDVVIGSGGSMAAVLDDSAVLRPPPPGCVMTQTVDFLRSSPGCTDPYVFGFLVANHCLSDCFAMGASPVSALATVVTPLAREALTEGDLAQSMAGAVEALNRAGCALVGGHTSEGAEAALGFSIYGTAPEGRVLTKAGLRQGDVLLLTKPIGVGVLLAAAAQRKTKGRWVAGALQAACESNGPASRVLLEPMQRRGGGPSPSTSHPPCCSACTDVTGFGLLGHAAEMARASRVTIEIGVSSVPLFPGAREAAAAGVSSSLYGANSRAVASVLAQGSDAACPPGCPEWALLLDPQTGGGLLAGVPEDVAQDVLSRLRMLPGCEEAAVVGRVVASVADADGPLILLT